MQFDVRVGAEDEITKIIFADQDDSDYFATDLTKVGDKLQITDDGGYCVSLKNKEHVENLIKALQKAIEIGWLK